MLLGDVKSFFGKFGKKGKKEPAGARPLRFVLEYRLNTGGLTPAALARCECNLTIAALLRRTSAAAKTPRRTSAEYHLLLPFVVDPLF